VIQWVKTHVFNGSNLSDRDLRRWINQERGTHSSSNGDSDNANEHLKHHHHYQQQQQQPRRRTKTYHGQNNQPISSFSKLINTLNCHYDDKLNYLLIFHERIFMLRSTE
jgi:hypothetical protein